MLAVAVRVITGAAHCFKPTQRLLGINLMAVSERQEATSYVLRIIGVIAVGFEHAEGTLIGRETKLIRYGRR